MTLTYAQTLADLYARTGKTFELGLGPITELLENLGRPHEQLHCIVVAGTNGKGSTATAIAQGIEKSGKKVGLYTSPHLLRFTQRIRINDVEITPDTVVQLFSEIKNAEQRSGKQPTFFECATAMAFLHFARAKVDFAVLEVGLGGRLDATNVARRILSVISSIDYDHQNYLGDTLEQIATEKAGIIASKVPVLCSRQIRSVENVLAERARFQNAPLRWAPEARRENDVLSLQGNSWFQATVIRPYHQPTFQDTNLALAAGALRCLEENNWVTNPPIEDVLKNFRHDGRYQWATYDDVAVLLDGAHNLGGVLALRQSMDVDSRVAEKPIHWVFSGLRERSLGELYNVFAKRVARVYSCPVVSKRSRTTDELRAALPHAMIFENSTSALHAAVEMAKRDHGIVLVSGSLYLVGEALAFITSTKTDGAVDG